MISDERKTGAPLFFLITYHSSLITSPFSSSIWRSVSRMRLVLLSAWMRTGNSLGAFSKSKEPEVTSTTTATLLTAYCHLPTVY